MHILFLNPQGNFDTNDSYWTMHPDFGGQLVYVKEIASSMALLGHKIDIVTRRFDDPNFPEFSQELDSYKGIDNLRIIRISCGPNKFLNKEHLWDYINEWTDNIISFYTEENQMFDFMTGHYADGGLACAILKSKLNIPYSFTGHSLGAQKLDKLHANLENIESLDQKYQFTKRIVAENTAIRYSDIIFVSTAQEMNEQYTHILYMDKTDSMTPQKFSIVPPGANTKMFAPYSEGNVSNYIMERIENIIIRDISKHRMNLPFIIAASRLDSKKNHIGLVKAYAKNQELQEMANLFISVRGIENVFDSYHDASPEEKNILSEILFVINHYSLIGKVTFISINSQQELADTYRYLTKRKSVFALTSLYEPFGLAPIEAMSTGLPAVVTKNGGPSEVLQEGKEVFGVLVDPENDADISNGLINAFQNYEYFKNQGKRRVLEKYTWQISALLYLEAIQSVLRKRTIQTVEINKFFIDKNISEIENFDLKQKYFK